MPSVQKQNIQEMFVEFDVREPEEVSEDCMPQSCRQYKRNISSKPIPSTDCIKTNDRVMILGNPGVGKTTLLKFVSHSLANSYVSGEDGKREIPIYIRLPEFCRAQEIDERVDFVKFIAAISADHCCADIEQPLREELGHDRRQCLLLLDGLDEIGNQEQKESLIESIKSFIDQYPKNRFVITSRIVGFDPSPWKNQQFAIFQIQEYNENQIEIFAQKWASIFSESEHKSKEEILKSLRTAIFSNPRVQGLASNPLILTILVLLNEARGGMLPRRRVDLYEKVVEVFLDTWESNKRPNEKFDNTYNIDIDAREFRWLLSDLALAMQKAEKILAPRWWITDRMQDYLQNKLGFTIEEAKDACDRIIRYLSERTGLIEERGLDLFGFSHRTLQEYFSSIGVLDEADASYSRDVTSGLRGYYYHPQWSEVIRLVAAQLTPSLAESLISAIMDDPDPVGRFLHRGHLLVLKCLNDGTTVANRRLVDSTFESLKKLGNSRWLGITLEALKVLESFQGTRYQKQADETVDSILKTAEKGLDKEDFHCLYERVHFKKIFESAHQKLFAEVRDAEAAREVAVTIADKQCHIVFINAKLLAENPKKWRKSVYSLLKDGQQSDCLKEILIKELGRKLATDRGSRLWLRQILLSKEDVPLRVASATALGAAVKNVRNIAELLLQVLDSDQDEEVRSACARSLRDAAENNALITNRLLEIIKSDKSTIVQSGAARGLAKASGTEPKARTTLIKYASLEKKSEALRVACAWSLKQYIGKDSDITHIFKSWLASSRYSGLQRVAAQSLATAMAEDKIEWDHQVVENAENILMNLKNPCACALESLEQIASAREIHQGLRLENILRETLQVFDNRIELAFIFGSTARNRQMVDSDIDILIIGDVNLKELSGPLRLAEKVLGRRISPSIYTKDSFQERYHTGDPFLLDVSNREKIPIIHKNKNGSIKEFDNELGTMVAERMAAKA
ncbi:MAG: NACHT domain-containing protein, partial [Thermoguttaceae bacterium]